VRFPGDDLYIVDRAAELNGLSRAEFVRRAALHKARLVLLNEPGVKLSPMAFDDFVETIDRSPQPPPSKMSERLARKPPWLTGRGQA